MDNIKKRYVVVAIVILVLVIGGYVLSLYLKESNQIITNDVDLGIEEKMDTGENNQTIVDQEEGRQMGSLVELPEISADFYEAVLQLSDPEILIAYLNKYFIVEDIEEEKTFTPQEFFENRGGPSNHFTLFISYILDRNDFEVAILAYKHRTEDNLESEQTLVAFRDIDIPKYIILTDSGIEIFTYGWSFQELLTKEENRLNIEIYKYAILPPRINNLVIEEWIDVDKTEN